MDFIIDQDLDFVLGNVVKCACRAGTKPVTLLDDLLKAQAYINKAIESTDVEHQKGPDIPGPYGSADRLIQPRGPLQQHLISRNMRFLEHVEACEQHTSLEPPKSSLIWPMSATSMPPLLVGTSTTLTSASVKPVQIR